MGSHLTLDGYQAQALQADRKPKTSLAFPLLGLIGETGTLLSVVKKKQRDATSYLGYSPHVIEELGDVLWYFAVVAARSGLTLSEIARELIIRPERAELPGAALLFTDLQLPPAIQQLEPTPAFERTLLELAARVGEVVAESQLSGQTPNPLSFKPKLMAVLEALIRSANEAGVTIEDAAIKNLHKIFDRWPLERVYPSELDASALKHERLPRKLIIDIEEREVGGKLYVFQQSQGINIGDRLTDNAVEPDDYRFHDVFHYAYCAVLGWSPVTRALLRLKRKSQPVTDEVQDGARAILIEEGIANWVFGQGKRHHNYFADLVPGDLSFDILKAVREFASDYEVHDRPYWLWEEAILEGFAAFRHLKERRHGRVMLDGENHKLRILE